MYTLFFLEAWLEIYLFFNLFFWGGGGGFSFVFVFDLCFFNILIII